MKKNNYILISVFIAATLLFGSCKSLTYFSIEKRQHLGGYYVDWGNGKVKTDPAKNTAVRAKQSKDTPKMTVAAKQKTKPAGKLAPVFLAEQKSSSGKSATVNSTEPKTKPSTTTFKVKEEAVAQRDNSSKKVINSFSYNLSDNDKAKPNMPDWAWVLLCLIPPLAVYLWFDSITSEFWISLLLTIL